MARRLGPRARVVAVVALVVTTAVTALVSWGVTQFATETTKRLGERNPISVTVESDPARTSASDGLRQVAIPNEPIVAPDPGPGGCHDLYAWARSIGGLDVEQTQLHLFTRGEVPGEVVISQVTVVVDQRSAPLDARQLVCTPEGDLTSRILTVDLDAAQPIARYTSADGRPFGFTLDQGEVEAFAITAVTSSSYVRWHLELQVVSGDEQRTLRVDDDGRPFATTAVRPGLRWWWSGTDWEPDDLTDGVATPPLVAPGQEFPRLPQ